MARVKKYLQIMTRVTKAPLTFIHGTVATQDMDKKRIRKFESLDLEIILATVSYFHQFLITSVSALWMKPKQKNNQIENCT
jgi:hypothetical protein